jgi:hypothetical protein
MIVSWIRLQTLCVHLGVDLRIALELVGFLAYLCPGMAHIFQGSVPSSSKNPFTDSHAISTLTDVAVGNLDGVEMSTYQSEDNSGRFMDFLSSTSMLIAD